MAHLALALLAYAPLLLLPRFRPETHWFLLAFVPAMVFYFYSFRQARRGSVKIGGIVWAAIILRLLFLGQEPTLSEDAYRYLWDGSVALSSTSPYRFSPEELARHQADHPDLYSRLAHRERTSIYPPLAQGLFMAASALGGSLIAWKLILLLSELLLFRLFVKLAVPSEGWVLWALHPLVIVEFYGSGHLDLIALVLVGWTFFFAHHRRWGVTAVLAAGAMAVKLFPLFAVPVAAGPAVWRRRILLGGLVLALFSVSFAGFVWVFPSPGDSLRSFAGIMATFQGSWQFNSRVFYYLGNRAFWGDPLIGAAVAFALLAGLKGRPSTLEELWTRYYFVVAVLYVCLHTVHPWYVSWILVSYPFLGLRYWAGLYLSLASVLSYLAYRTEPPREAVWVLWLEYLPFCLLLLRDAYAYHEARHGSKTSISESRTE